MGWSCSHWNGIRGLCCGWGYLKREHLQPYEVQGREGHWWPLFFRTTQEIFFMRENVLKCLSQTVQSTLHVTDYWVFHPLPGSPDRDLTANSFSFTKKSITNYNWQPHLLHLPCKTLVYTSRFLLTLIPTVITPHSVGMDECCLAVGKDKQDW